MKPLLVALLLLIVGTGAASAECAWVLWSYSLGTTVEVYNVDSAHRTREECNRNVRDFAAVLKADGFTVRGGTASVPEVIGQKGTTRFKYFCLPDTVDPRGAKGK